MEPIFRRLADEVERIPHPHPHHNYAQTEHPYPAPEASMLPIIANIETDLRNAGHDVENTIHEVLSRHLTIGNLAAHVGQFVAGVEASPVAQVLERYALGPAGEAAVAKAVAVVADILTAQATPAPAA